MNCLFFFRCHKYTKPSPRPRHGQHVFLVFKKVNYRRMFIILSIIHWLVLKKTKEKNQGCMCHFQFMTMKLYMVAYIRLNIVVKFWFLFFFHFLSNQSIYVYAIQFQFRSYKNGFVWQDLSDNDFIYPCHGHEYILKGSLLLETSLSFRSYETISLSTSKSSSEKNGSIEDSDSPVIRRKNHSWTTFNDLEEHKVYKAKTTGEFASKGANVSTQTDDNRRVKVDAQEVEHQGPGNAMLSRGEVSPMLVSKSCSSVHESLKRSIEGHSSPDNSYQMAANDHLNARMKASKILMKLIGCGSKRFKQELMVCNA